MPPIVRSGVRAIGWTAVVILAIVAIGALIGSAAANPGGPDWQAWVVAALAAVASFVIYRALARTEARDTTSVVSDSGPSPRVVAIADVADRGGLVRSRFLLLPMFIAGFAYIAWLTALLLLWGFLFQLFGIDLDDGSAFTGILLTVVAVTTFLLPIVLLAVGYRWLIRTARRRFPRWAGFFGLGEDAPRD